MGRNNKLGDSMPLRRDVKWGSMVPSDSHLSNEWHTLDASEPSFSEKWVEQHPSSGHMSDRFVEMNAGSAPDDRWHEMKQEGREDPYSMAPSSGDRKQSFKSSEKVRADNKVSRANQHTDFGSVREI